METALVMNDPNIWLLLVVSLISMGLSLSKGAGKVVLSFLILGMSTLLLHDALQKQSDSAFVLDRFAKGERIECGLWRGEHTIADPMKGWRLEEGRFISEDTLLTDPGLCNVIGKEPPEVSWAGPVTLYLLMFALQMLGRFGVFEQYGLEFWSGKKRVRDHRNGEPGDAHAALTPVRAGDDATGNDEINKGRSNERIGMDG